MTPQAQQIVDRFKPLTVSDCLHSFYCQEKECTEPDGSIYCHADLDTAIQCAIVAVEMLYRSTRSIDCDPPGFPISESHREYWLPILTELKNELK